MPKKTKTVNSRTKGGRGEREVAKLFSAWWGSEFARTPLSGGFHTKKFRDDWNAEGDLVTPDPTFPFSVEVKWQEGWTLDQLLLSDKGKVWSWWEQATHQTSEDKIPCLVFKRNYNPWLFMMYDNPDIKIYPTMSLPDPNVEQVVVGKLECLLRTEKELWL